MGRWGGTWSSGGGKNHDQNIVYKNVFSIKNVCFVNRFSNLAVEITEESVQCSGIGEETCSRQGSTRLPSVALMWTSDEWENNDVRKTSFSNSPDITLYCWKQQHLLNKVQRKINCIKIKEKLRSSVSIVGTL